MRPFVPRWQATILPVAAPGARFRKAQLEKARLSKADLTRANFYRADLSDANLRWATLHGAGFKRSTLAGAEFYGAELDDKALESILEAEDWELAQFSEPDRSRLEELRSS